jgi:hypothetical protein
MVAINLNGNIKTFSKIPSVWTDENGTHFNIKEGFGFLDVVTPAYDSRVEELSAIKLVGNVYTYDVIDRVIVQTLAELKAQKIDNLNSVTGRKLEDIQWHWDRDKRTEGAKPVSQEIKDLDVSIRLENDNIKSEINALTTKKAVLIFDLPNSNIS